MSEKDIIQNYFKTAHIGYYYGSLANLCSAISKVYHKTIQVSELEHILNNSPQLKCTFHIL